MSTKMILMSLLLMIKSWPYISSFDPDVDICQDLRLSGGVVAEDGETYLFKGDYYWRTRPLTTDSGIVGYANLTKNKWPEVTDKIRLVFTVSNGNALITVFVLKNKWIGYQNGLKTIDGTVENWPDFQALKVTAAFTPTFGSNLVYVLYSDNNYYILYDFTNLSKPRKVRAGAATIRSNYLVFTEDSSLSMPGMSIRSLIDLRVGLTYREKIFLLSAETFCSINLIAQSFERECHPQDVNNILGCPLDLSRRPTPPTTTTMKSKTTPSLTTMEIIKESSTPVSKTSSEGVSVEEPFPSDWESNDTLNGDESDTSQTFRTGIPILGHDLEKEEEFKKTDNATPQMAGGVEADIIQKNQQKSEFWFVVIVVMTVVVCVTSVIVVVVITQAMKKKRPKGEIITTQSQKSNIS